MHTLPTFRTVAQLSNLRGAAEALHLTHSAVSQQIQLLEAQLGFKLFDRRGRRIALNAAGAALLRAVEPALDQLDDGVRAAAAAAAGTAHRIRLTLVPSFTQRWLLPRMGRWREQHPDIALELHAGQQLVDLRREGFQAAVRQGAGHWRGLVAERLTDSPLIAVGSPSMARRLLGRELRALADEPLLGSRTRWTNWFAHAGLQVQANTVAAFNDSGMMLQAAEQELGVALARELLAADALHSGRLVRLFDVALPDDGSDVYWLVYPPALRDWPPLSALRDWLHEELALSQRRLAQPLTSPPGKATASRSGSRSRARSA